MRCATTTSSDQCTSATPAPFEWPMPTRPFKLDRKSTRLNSSHSQISYAVFCLKKKNKYDSYVLFENHPRLASDLLHTPLPEPEPSHSILFHQCFRADHVRSMHSPI